MEELKDKQATVLTEEGYLHIGEDCYLRDFYNSKNDKVVVIKVFLDKQEIHIYVGGQLMDTKIYKSNLAEDSFMKIINAKIRFYIE